MAAGITPWVSKTKPIIDGEQVRSTVANRFPGQVAQRTQHLKERLDAIGANDSLVDYGAAIDSAVKIGQAVYFDPSTQTYKQAKAALEEDPISGAFNVALTSYVVGILLAKETATRGDVLLAGIVRDFDFTHAIGSTGNSPSVAGAYYLSASQPGKYTLQKPPVGIYVLFLRGDGSAIVNPTPRELLESHIHYAFDLYAQPAGVIDCPEPDRVYQFVSVDPLSPGWLPADHAVFGGTAPAGAKYGYNLSAHPKLERVWPPVPTGSSYLEMNGIGVAAGRYRVDVNGLWWFEDCYGKAPWPTEEQSCNVSPSSSSSSPSSSSSSGATCASGELLEQMGFVRNDPKTCRMKIYFVKMVLKTSNAVVTSLNPAAGSPITVSGCTLGVAAETGDLCLDFDASLMTRVPATEGYQVIKDMVGNSLLVGPVVEGIKAGASIVISPVSGKSEVDEDGFVKGLMQIAVSLPGSDQEEAQLTLIALDGVKEDNSGSVFFLSFPNSRRTKMQVRVVLKNDIVIAPPLRLELSAWLLGRAVGGLPALKMARRILPRPDGCTPQSLPAAAEVAMADLPTCTITQVDQYVEVTSEELAVNAGDQVFFTIERQGDVDSYPGDVGVLKLGMRLFTAE